MFKTTPVDCARLLVGQKYLRLHVGMDVQAARLSSELRESLAPVLARREPQEYCRGVVHTLRTVLWLLHSHTPAKRSKSWECASLLVTDLAEICAHQYLGLSSKAQGGEGSKQTVGSRGLEWVSLKASLMADDVARWVDENKAHKYPAIPFAASIKHYFPLESSSVFLWGALVGADVARYAIDQVDREFGGQSLARVTATMEMWMRALAHRWDLAARN